MNSFIQVCQVRRVLAWVRVWWFMSPYDLDSVPDREPDDIEAEIQLLDAAFATVREDLRLLSERLYPTFATRRARFI